MHEEMTQVGGQSAKYFAVAMLRKSVGVERTDCRGSRRTNKGQQDQTFWEER